MNSNISNGFYIWGQFDIASTELISFLQREVNNDLQGPEFVAHLTLTGPVNYELEICKNLLEELCNRFTEFSISLNGIGFKDKFFQAFFPLGKIYYHTFLLENLNILISWEQIKGANKPVKKTSAKIFLILGINIKELLSEKFLNKICKK